MGYWGFSERGAGAQGGYYIGFSNSRNSAQNSTLDSPYANKSKTSPGTTPIYLSRNNCDPPK